MLPNHVIIFLLLSFSQVVGSLYQTRNIIFAAFCECESILGRKSPNVIVSFHFLSCCIHSPNVSFILHWFPFISHSFPFIFLSCCSHFAFISFHVPFILHFFHFAFPFILFPFLILHSFYRSSKDNMFKPVRWVSVKTLAFFSYFVIVLLSFWRPVQVAISRVNEHVQV